MKKLLEIFMIFIIIFTMISYTNISNASEKSDLKNKASSIQDQINDAKDDLEDIASQKSENLKQIQSLVADISSYQEDIDDLSSKISDLKSQINDMEKQIKSDEDEYNKQRELLDERIVASYKTGNTSYLDFLLSSSNIMDMISSYFLISKVADYDQNLMEEVNTHREKIEADKKKIEDSKKELETSQKTITAKQQSLQVAKKEKEAYSAKLSEDEKKTEAQIEEMQQDKAEINKKLDQIAKAEREKKKNQNSNSNSTNSSNQTYVDSEPSSSGYIFPVAGLSKANINRKTYPSYPGHTGVDINIGVVGKSVVAVKDGTVEISDAQRYSNGEYRGYGEYVIINHHDGTMTLYGHMLSGTRRVSKGQSVKQGQVIGTVGSTGNSTGTHLHFEVRTLANSYRAVNPLPYLP